MKKILVPFDFSDYAINALKYALGLANQFNCTVSVLHIYNTRLIETDLVTDTYATYDTQRATVAPVQNTKSLIEVKFEESMSKLQKTLQEDLKREVYFDHSLVQGATPDKIMEAAKRIDADIILMSNKGDDDSLNFFGSNTTEVLRHSDTPILLIPFEMDFKAISKVAYATDYRDTDGDAIEKLIAIFDQTNVKFYSLHVNPTSKLPKITEIHSTYTDLNLEFDVINAENVLNGIHFFTDEHRIQIVAMNRKKRNMVKQLFAPSITEKMIADSFFPILVINT